MPKFQNTDSGLGRFSPPEKLGLPIKRQRLYSPSEDDEANLRAFDLSPHVREEYNITEDNLNDMPSKMRRDDANTLIPINWVMPPFNSSIAENTPQAYYPYRSEDTNVLRVPRNLNGYW